MYAKKESDIFLWLFSIRDTLQNTKTEGIII